MHIFAHLVLERIKLTKVWRHITACITAASKEECQSTNTAWYFFCSGVLCKVWSLPLLRLVCKENEWRDKRAFSPDPGSPLPLLYLGREDLEKFLVFLGFFRGKTRFRIFECLRKCFFERRFFAPLEIRVVFVWDNGRGRIHIESCVSKDRARHKESGIPSVVHIKTY